MGRSFEGTLAGSGLRFAVVASRFNGIITERLLTGALDAFRRHGVDAAAIDVAWTPGAFELPLVAKKLAATGQYAAVLALGAVIRGDTAHFEHVAAQAAAGIARAALDTGVPVIFGVLTTDTLEQATDRAGGKGGNKGFAAAVAAIEMAQLVRALPSESR
ncbi:MAG: 6,7-dimethyl-8-ribityllumazine synthase [Deltaproteobacteria bacterium]|nr:6,7-dimethyl-8-ribityllumazine synthase [Deltaproteobacteria bacterium]